MFKRLLVPLDGSRFASRALHYASEVANRFGSEIILLQVVTPSTPVPTTTGMTPGIESPASAEIAVQIALDNDKRNISHARRYLSGKARGMRSQNIKVSREVIVGEPTQSIMRFSKKEHVDLVVMTTHGKSGIRRAIMGSVADAVIRKSGKPVLVVRPHSRSQR